MRVIKALVYSPKQYISYAIASYIHRELLPFNDNNMLAAY